MEARKGKCGGCGEETGLRDRRLPLEQRKTAVVVSAVVDVVLVTLVDFVVMMMFIFHRGRHTPTFTLLLGLVILIALTGCVLFTLFLLLATANAIVIELLMFASAVGTFTALFTSLTLIYVGVLTVAAFAIGTTAVMYTFVVLFVRGWIAFAWVVWQLVKNSMHVVKNSLALTGKSISSMSVLGQLQQVIMLEDHPKLDIPPAPL